MMNILVPVIAGLSVLCAIFRVASTRPQKMTGDAVGLALVSALPLAAHNGWLHSAVTTGVLGVVLLWFIWRTTLGASKPGALPGSGRGASGYHAALTLTAIWIAFVLGNRFQGGQDETLGAIMQHMIVGVMLALAAAGWLLASFAVPKDDKAAIKPIIGVQEALSALTVGLCFFTAI